jgi:hypothetical protein
MVRVVVAARTNRVSRALPVIVSDGLNGYSLGGDGRRPPDFVVRQFGVAHSRNCPIIVSSIKGPPNDS